MVFSGVRNYAEINPEKICAVCDNVTNSSKLARITSGTNAAIRSSVTAFAYPGRRFCGECTTVYCFCFRLYILLFFQTQIVWRHMMPNIQIAKPNFEKRISRNCPWRHARLCIRIGSQSQVCSPHFNFCGNSSLDSN